MELTKRIETFQKLGSFLRDFSDGKLDTDYFIQLNEIVCKDNIYNPWFTEDNIRQSIKALGYSLQTEKLEFWVRNYPDLAKSGKANRIGVITAGNIPLVGFHDFITVLISGNVFIGKLSSKDNRLLKFIADFLIDINPDFETLIHFTEDKLENFDAIIATGSNNTSRYFEYYFGKYPNIIRKNRNSVAVLTGNESKEEIGNIMSSQIHSGLNQ